MNVAVSALRADLANWISQVRDGEVVIITDRGVPVARLLPVDASPLLERLTRDGLVSKPRQLKNPTATRASRVSAHGSVADLVSDLRQ